MNTEIETETPTCTLPDFMGMPSTIDPESSYQVQDSLRKRFVTANKLRMEELLLCAGFSPTQQDAAFRYVYDNCSALLGDSTTFDQFSSDLEALIEDSLAALRDFLVSAN